LDGLWLTLKELALPLVSYSFGRELKANKRDTKESKLVYDRGSEY
jgi:hypothetical protein